MERLFLQGGGKNPKSKLFLSSQINLYIGWPVALSTLKILTQNYSFWAKIL